MLDFFRVWTHTLGDFSYGQSLPLIPGILRISAWVMQIFQIFQIFQHACETICAFLKHGTKY